MTTSLKRCLSLWEIVVYGVGLILGAGIYVLVGPAAGIAGNMLWLSFLLAAVVAGLTAVSYAELSTLFPKSGAEFLYVKAAFGSEAIAWIVGFCAVIIGVSTASTVAVGFAGYFDVFLDSNSIIVAAILILLMTLMNFWGIEESARFNLIATIIEVGGLMIIILIGGIQLFNGTNECPDYFTLPAADSSQLGGFMSVAAASALIFFAYIGFEDIANIAEEAEQPLKILPKAFLYSLFISTLLYVLVAIIVVSVIDPDQLAKSDQPLSMVIDKLIGGSSSNLIAIIALFATANTVLITLIVAARMLYGMSSEGSIPGIFNRVHSKRQTPWFAIIVAAILSWLLLGFKEIEVLASITDVGVFLLFFSVNVSNILLRYKQPHRERPWRTPFNIGSFPILSGLGAISCIALMLAINHPVHIFEKEVSSLIVGLIILMLALPLYLLWNWLKPRK